MKSSGVYEMVHLQLEFTPLSRSHYKLCGKKNRDGLASLRRSGKHIISFIPDQTWGFAEMSFYSNKFNKIYCWHCGSDITFYLDSIGILEGNCPVCGKPVSRQDFQYGIFRQYWQHWKEWRQLSTLDWILILIVATYICVVIFYVM
jgi:hypothetical protein